jgi:two-component system, NtrC family, sensor kinase
LELPGAAKINLRYPGYMKLSIRTIQVVGYALVVLLMGLFAVYAGLSFIGNTVGKEAQMRVQMDLNSAWVAYNEEKTLLQMTVSLVSQHEVLRSALRNEISTDSLISLLERLRVQYKLDFLTLINRDSIILGTSSRQGPTGLRVRSDPVIQQALHGMVSSGSTLISRENLLRKSKDLAAQAYISLVETKLARPTTRRVEDRGLAMESAIPILDKREKVNGVVYGGILLNRRYDLVDRIRSAVFDTAYYQGRPLGTVTIFLWDTRIATNVIQADSTRAIGTRVSEAVYRTVLEQGKRFGDRAFVVNDWYLSAYDPIRDPGGHIIGILFVGLLEKKYLDYKASLTKEFLAFGLVALLISVGLATYFSGKIRRPILKLLEATRHVSSGELTTRVQPVAGTLELDELARSFNLMAESLENDRNQLQEAFSEVESALKKADEKNRAYLEMLGFVTHELKSPLASIVFAIGSLRDNLLGPLNPAQEAVLKSSAKSADYLNATIANFLNLSRIEDGALKLKQWKVFLRGTVIDPAIQRLSEMLGDNEMKIYCDIAPNLEVTCDPDLLTSVFQNLISNAVKYGKKGSQIVITQEKEPNSNCIRLSIRNEGHGFSQEEARGLFTKFTRFNARHYDTKSGTGLGLFVTRNIINQHGGDIWAESQPGHWAKFIFTLRKRLVSHPGERSKT